MDRKLKEKLDMHVRINSAALVTDRGSVVGSFEYVTDLKSRHGGLIYLGPWVMVGNMVYQRGDDERMIR